jgi:hypothetical protein
MFISRVAARSNNSQAAAPMDHPSVVTRLTMELCNFGSILADEMVSSSSSSSMEEGYLRLSCLPSRGMVSPTYAT